MLGSLRSGEAVTGKREVRDRKNYIMDPAREPSRTVRWLEEHADRELEPVDGLRRFELLWNPEAFVATRPAIEPVFRDLAVRGYPADLQFSMLHPVAVFDGTKWHRNRANMPLLRGYNLESPIAALRVASRELETERARLTETTATITRLEADLGEAKSQSSAAARRFSAERETWLQQKTALQAGNTALKGELAETQSRLSSAVDLRAQRDSQIAQLRAEIEDAARQSELQQNALDALQSQQREWDAARHRLETEIRDLRAQLEARSHENETTAPECGGADEPRGGGRRAGDRDQPLSLAADRRSRPAALREGRNISREGTARRADRGFTSSASALSLAPAHQPGGNRPSDQARHGSCAAAQRTGKRRTMTVPANMSCSVRLCRLNRTSSRISEQVAPTVI